MAKDVRFCQSVYQPSACRTVIELARLARRESKTKLWSKRRAVSATSRSSVRQQNDRDGGWAKRNEVGTKSNLFRKLSGVESTTRAAGLSGSLFRSPEAVAGAREFLRPFLSIANSGYTNNCFLFGLFLVRDFTCAFFLCEIYRWTSAVPWMFSNWRNVFLKGFYFLQKIKRSIMSHV